MGSIGNSYLLHSGALHFLARMGIEQAAGAPFFGLVKLVLCSERDYTIEIIFQYLDLFQLPCDW